MRGRSRKQLKLLPVSASATYSEQQEPQILNVSNRLSVTTDQTKDDGVAHIHFDHSYDAQTMASTGTADMSCTDKTLSVLKEMFMIEKEDIKLPQNEILQTLRSQSFSLTSKPAPFAPVLCFKGSNQIYIVTHDRIVHIIHEMEKR